ncbi:MAG TPA: hypothetical protein VHN37_03340 [Actinomycetota bacterium]|nr:hypothetical protein [Actinomycetota bacterium]
MGGRDDLDLYGRGAAPDRGVGRAMARIVGLLVGAAVSLFGVALFLLRCFDTCPADPAVNTSGQLLSGAVVLFGVVVAVSSLAAGTAGATGVALFAGAAGVLIAVAGVVSFALVQSVASVVAVLAGAVVTAAALFALKGATRTPD